MTSSALLYLTCTYSNMVFHLDATYFTSKCLFLSKVLILAGCGKLGSNYKLRQQNKQIKHK